MYKGKIGVAIISFNRPKYLSRVINSLEQQSYLENTKFHLFQDGFKNIFSGKIKAKREEIEQSIAFFKSSNLDKGGSIFRVDENVGNGRNQYIANEIMSSLYDYFLVVEDDVLLSPDYLRLCRVLIDQFGGRSDLHSFNLNFKKLREPSAKSLNKVIFGETHWWAECYISRQWKIAKEYFKDYFRLIEEVDYSDIPREKIQELFKKHNFNKTQCSQDAGKDFALFKAKFKRITAVVNRGYYIGQQGIHFTPKLYQKMGWQNQLPYIFKSDQSLNQFILIEK